MKKPTTPRADQLAAHVPPLVRAYIDAAIAEAMSPIEARLAAVEDRLRSFDATMAGWTGNVQARLNKFERDLSFAPRTRRELRRMLEDLVERNVAIPTDEA